MGSFKDDYMPAIWLDPMWSIYGAVWVLSFCDKSRASDPVLATPEL